jgi:hypothetical protein
MYAHTSQAITGHRNEPVPHTFLRQEADADHVAVLLPGIGYTSHMPLLYYPAKIMLGVGADVLRLEYEYSRREEFMALAGAERKRWLLDDVRAACDAVFAARPYRRVTLIGKSLGTRAMAHLVASYARCAAATAVWLTPLVRSDSLRREIGVWAGRSLFVIGTADPHYDAAFLDEVVKATGGERLVVDGADHSLEIEGDLPRSLDVLGQVVRAVEAFVTA